MVFLGEIVLFTVREHFSSSVALQTGGGSGGSGGAPDEFQSLGALGREGRGGQS
jgi:hypothetical protein